MVLRIVAMFDAPTVPLTVSMVRPIPAVLLKQLDRVPQVGCRARRPANGAELSHVDMHIVRKLKLTHRCQHLAELLLVPRGVANLTGISNAGYLVVNSLVRELAGHVHVYLIDHVGHMTKDRPRGVSQQMGAADAVYMLHRDPDIDTVVMKTEKDPKDFESPPELTFKAGVQELPTEWNDEDGEPTTTLVIRPISAAPMPMPMRAEPLENRMGEKQEKMMEVLRESYYECRKNLEESGRDPVSARIELRGWKKSCVVAGIPRTTINSAMPKLAERGLVIIDGVFVYLT